MMVVAAGGVALATALAAPAPADSADQASASVATAARAAQPAAWTRAHHRLAKLVAAPSAPVLAPAVLARRLDPAPADTFVASLSSPLRASRGPPASSIAHR